MADKPSNVALEAIDGDQQMKKSRGESTKNTKETKDTKDTKNTKIPEEKHDVVKNLIDWLSTRTDIDQAKCRELHMCLEFKKQAEAKLKGTLLTANDGTNNIQHIKYISLDLLTYLYKIMLEIKLNGNDNCPQCIDEDCDQVATILHLCGVLLGELSNHL